MSRPRVRRHRVRAAGWLAAATVGIGALSPVAALATSNGKPPGPTDEVLAVVSPLSLPVCEASGSATLLVPIVGGLLQDKLQLPKSVNVGNLLLGALGPVYIVCGDLPSGPGTHCSLDNQIAGLWPESLSSDSLTAPAPVGDIIDSLSAALKILHLNLLDATKQALQCQVPKSAAPPPAPPAVLAPTLPVGGAPQPGATLPGSSAAASPTLPTLATAPPSSDGSAPQLAQPEATNPSLVSSITHRLPTGVVAVQIALALFLALVLLGGWLTSGQLSRVRSRRGGDSS